MIHFIEGGVQQLYDPTHIWCDYPNKVDCGDRPICDENDENCNAAPTTDPTAPTKAPFVCPEPSGYFADPNNCMKYYHCYDGVPEEHKICPLDEGKSHLFMCDITIDITIYLFKLIYVYYSKIFAFLNFQRENKNYGT